MSAVLRGFVFVIVGGVAAAAYAAPRFTKDVDVLAQGSDQATLLRAGASQLGSLSFDSSLGLRGTSWRLAHGSELDLLVSDESWAQAAIGNPTLDPSGRRSWRCRTWC